MYKLDPENFRVIETNQIGPVIEGGWAGPFETDDEVFFDPSEVYVIQHMRYVLLLTRQPSIVRAQLRKVTS